MTRTLSIEEVPGHADFRALRKVPGIRIDLRYASSRTTSSVKTCTRHSIAPGSIARRAERLEAAAKWLRARRRDRHLLVLDALRPQRVQQRLWEALEGTDLQAYLADPAPGLDPFFGMAVDVTLVDSGGDEIDMGTPFDDMTEQVPPGARAGAARERRAREGADRQPPAPAQGHGARRLARHQPRVVAFRRRRSRADPGRIPARPLVTRARPRAADGAWSQSSNSSRIGRATSWVAAAWFRMAATT
jgi:D-alanyl-D-alanine dipeptidase